MFSDKQEHSVSDVININGKAAIPSISTLLRRALVCKLCSAGPVELVWSLVLEFTSNFSNVFVLPCTTCAYFVTYFC